MESHRFADTESPATDPAALDRLRRFGGPKLLGDMIALFLQAAPERLAAARDGLARHDPVAVEQALHALKSSAAQLGATRMQRLSAQAEQVARSGSLAGASDLLAELDAEQVRVRLWLTAQRDEARA